MTDIKQLKDAVRRYRANDHYAKDARIYLQMKYETAKTIADALLDQTPLSRSTLEGLGFELSNHQPFITVTSFVRDTVRVALDSADGSLCSVWVDERIANPQPTTTGQLLWLLMSLEERNEQ